jgi:hypothetical protein
MHFILAGVILFLQFSGVVQYCNKIEEGQKGFSATSGGPKEKDDKKKN